MKPIALITGLLLISSPAFAEGDAAAGEKAFKKCKACHMIVSDAGETIVKGGKTGPNLYGLPGRTIGAYDGYKYSKSLAAVAETGAVWNEESFVAYTANPNDYLKATLDDSKAKSKMSFRLKAGAEDVYAYLNSLTPSAE